MEKQYAPTQKEKKMNVSEKPMKQQKQAQEMPKTQQPASIPQNAEASNVPLADVPAKAIDNKSAVTQQATGVETKEQKKEEKKAKVKKEDAFARGVSLPISKKHAMYISTFIKGKSVDAAIADLEQVIKLKKAVPFKGEIPHRHDPGVMSGRYPVNASKAIMQVLKGLRGNIAVNGLDASKARIYFASASWASRPMKKGGARFKRTHIVIKAKEIETMNNKQEKKR